VRPADTDITVQGLYHTAGTGCHGSDNAEGCLSWRVRIPSAIAPKGSTNVTIEADSVPGQWTWSCPSPEGNEVAGTSSFYIDKGEGEPPALMADSGLSSISELYNPLLDDSIGSVKAVSCTPEHLKLTYAVNFYTYWDKTSYFDLDLGTTVVAPGVDTRSYRFTPTIEVSTRNAILRPAVTAHKPAASAAHTTVSTNEVTVEGAAKDTARFTMTARNDSTTVLSGFTISAGRVRGRAQAASVTCDLTAFGGEVVSAKGPAENLKVSSGKAKVPEGKEVTCQVDLTGVVGRNTITAGVTTGDQTFSSDYTDDRPVGEVSAKSSQSSIEVAPTGTYKVEVEYTVTFTNKTDAEGRTSDVVLRPHLPAGVDIRNMWGTGLPWRVDINAFVFHH